MFSCYDDSEEDLRNDASAEGTLTIEALREELCHMYQHRYLEKDDLTLWRHMVEYEYALFADINRFVRYGGNTEMAMEEKYWFCCVSTNLDYQPDYEQFLKDITLNGTKYGYRPITREEFYKWAQVFGEMNRTYNVDRGYNYDVDYTMTINDLLELAKNNCGK